MSAPLSSCFSATVNELTELRSSDAFVGKSQPMNLTVAVDRGEHSYRRETSGGFGYVDFFLSFEVPDLALDLFGGENSFIYEQ